MNRISFKPADPFDKIRGERGVAGGLVSLCRRDNADKGFGQWGSFSAEIKEMLAHQDESATQISGPIAFIVDGFSDAWWILREVIDAVAK